MDDVNDGVRKLATEIAFHRGTCAHEAGHVAAALLQGLHVASVTAPFHTMEDVERAADDDAVGHALIRRPETPEQAQRMAISIMCGPLAENRAGWPPRWPLTLVRGTNDEHQFAAAVEQAGLDRKGYEAMVRDALALSACREFDLLALAVGRGLEQHGHLTHQALRRIQAVAQEISMERTVKAATVTAADQGRFTAIAAAYTIDRVNDQIMRGAFAKSIEAWRASGKYVPLHWNHEGAAASIIGAIDPVSMRETDQGLQVSGMLDLDASDMAREAWRAMKTNSMSLSFGYAVTRSHERRDGVQVLEELDLFEVSIVPAPANRDTRVLEMKSADDRHVPTVGELREREAALGLAGAINRLGGSRTRIPTQRDLDRREDALQAAGVLEAVSRVRRRRGRDLDDALDRMRDATREQMTAILGGKSHPPRDDLRRRATEATAEYELERAMTFNPRA